MGYHWLWTIGTLLASYVAGYYAGRAVEAGKRADRERRMEEAYRRFCRQVRERSLSEANGLISPSPEDPVP